MKLSMVIPTYTINKTLEGMAIDACTSYKDQVDELIICEDGGMYSIYLSQIADSYILNNNNVGFTANVNRGWRYASGDYVAIVNSDTMLKSGKLEDLCQPGRVMCPFIVSHPIEKPYSLGAFWVAPRDVTLRIGYLNESMKTYVSDAEYETRVEDILIKTDKVKIYHSSEETTRAAGIDRRREEERDHFAWERIKMKEK